MPGAKGASGGHNRKTTARHEVEGTFRKHRHNKRVDAKVAPATLPCPGELSEVGQEAWRTVVNELPRESITKLDRSALLHYCRDMQVLEAIWPNYIADPSDKNWRMAVKEVLERISKAERKFGLNPLDRAALVLPGDEEDESDLDVLLKRKRERAGN